MRLQATGFPQLVPENGILCNTSDMRFDLGQLVMDKVGNLYRYVKANEAIAFGELVTHVALGTWDSGIAVDGAITASTTNVVHIDTITTAMTGNQYAGYYIRQGEAAGKGKLWQIKSHPAMAASGEGDLTMERTLDEAFADDAALSIFNPFLVELVDADTEQICGVGIGTITSTYYGFVQVGGIHPGVLCDGSNGQAVVANEPIVPYGTDPGQGQGMAGSAEGDIMELATSPLLALDASTTDAGYVPAKFVRVV